MALMTGQLHQTSLFLWNWKWFILTRRNIKFCTIWEYGLVFSACFMYWLCLWVQQLLNLQSWNFPHLVFNQQAILQPGLLGILESAFTGPGEDRAGDTSSVGWKEKCGVVERTCILKPKNVTLCLISITSFIFNHCQIS